MTAENKLMHFLGIEKSLGGISTAEPKGTVNWTMRGKGFIKNILSSS